MISSLLFSGWTRIPLLAACFFPAFALARLGENETQCNGRYGTPLTDQWTSAANKKTPLVPAGYTRTYNYQGWVIRIAYLEFNGPAIAMHFRKKTGGSIADDELTAIVNANTPQGMGWALVPYTNSSLEGSSRAIGNIGSQMIFGAKAWQRTDGVVAILEPLRMELILKSPAAMEIEKKARESKEEQRRAAIPGF